MIFFHTDFGFLDSDIHGDPPAGAVEISSQDHASLMAGQAEGRCIVSVNGYPQLTEAPEPAVVVPASVSRFQAKAALHQAGLLADAEAAIAAADYIAQIAWSDAAEWRRDSPTIAALAATLGLTDEQVDQLFITATQISA